MVPAGPFFMVGSCVFDTLRQKQKQEAGGMFDKKTKKNAEDKSNVCQICGLDCRDKVSLERHVDWAHKAQKNSVKP